MRLFKAKIPRLALWGLPAMVVLSLGLLQLYNTPLEVKPVTGHIQVPDQVISILQRSCYNCHSNETDLSWFDKIAPVSWAVNKDVHRAREVMNFSEWDKISPEAHIGKMWAILNMTKAGKMPLPKYTLVHPEAKLSEIDVQTIQDYVVSITPDRRRYKGDAPENQTTNLANVSSNSTNKRIAHSPNGINYSDDFKKWKVISMTTLYDNSMRIVYGNDIAVKAIKEENFHPWPDGATVVKAVWQQVENEYGEVRPGNFQNTQFMVKDSEKFKDTEGWGFAKFSTNELIPTGKTAFFAAQSCIGCHRQLAEETGFLFNVPLKVNPIN